MGGHPRHRDTKTNTQIRRSNNLIFPSSMVNSQNFSKQSLIFAFLNLAEIFAEIFGIDQTEFYHSAYNC